MFSFFRSEFERDDLVHASKISNLKYYDVIDQRYNEREKIVDNIANT